MNERWQAQFLCFMTHSLVSKYTNVICVIAVNSLEAEKLQEYFGSIALHGLCNGCLIGKRHCEQIGFLSVLSLDRSICSWANAPYYYLSNMMRRTATNSFLGTEFYRVVSHCFLQPTQQAGRKFPVFLTRHHLETVSGKVPCLREHGLTRYWTLDNDFTVRHANR